LEATVYVSLNLTVTWGMCLSEQEMFRKRRANTALTELRGEVGLVRTGHFRYVSGHGKRDGPHPLGRDIEISLYPENERVVDNFCLPLLIHRIIYLM
jgi:hypothetical protein